jgi:hypothetical protein
VVIDEITAIATVAVPQSPGVPGAAGTAPDGRVTFFLDGKAISTQSAAAGTVEVDLPAEAVRAAGEHTLVARYLGSSTQEASASQPTTYTGTGDDDAPATGRA